jgi:hypothetical protein
MRICRYNARSPPFPVYRQSRRAHSGPLLLYWEPLLKPGLSTRSPAFHQNEVRNDPDLLRWVKKRDYFDYSPPEGWEKYLDARKDG